MNDDLPFDRELRRRRRDRSAARADGDDYLARLMADELLDRLDLVQRDFHHALDLGCANGRLTSALRAKGMSVVSADPGFAFARKAGGIQCDEDRLPFADAAFDLIVSAGTLDSVNDLPGALALIRRALKPDGLFLACFPGAGSGPALRKAMLAADTVEGGGVSPHLHPQIDVRTGGDLLSRAGFALPVADSHRLAIRYESLAQLVGDLRAAAGTNILSLRSKRPIGRLGYAAAMADFAADAEGNGRTTETLEIIAMIGWAPAPGQPQPARRGSGTTSLADALRPRDA